MCSQRIALNLGIAILVPTQQLLTATLIALANQALAQAKVAGRYRNVRLQEPDSLNAQANLAMFVGLKGTRLIFWDLA